MRATAIVGVVLVILGIAALLYGGVSWTEETTVLDIGPLEAEAEETKGVAIPPLLGYAAIAGGVVLIAIGWKRRGRTS